MSALRKELYDAIINHLLVVLAGWFVGGYVLWKFLLAAAEDRAKENTAQLAAAREKTEKDTAAVLEDAKRNLAEAIAHATDQIRRAEADAKNHFETQRIRWQKREYVGVYASVATVFFGAIESVLEGPQASPIEGAGRIYLDSAIRFSEMALGEANSLLGDSATEEETARVARIRAHCANNLAYLLAVGQRAEDRDRALELCSDALQLGKSSPEAHRFEDTYWWVRLLYNDDITRAQAELRELYGRAGLPRSWQRGRLAKLDRWGTATALPNRS